MLLGSICCGLQMEADTPLTGGLKAGTGTWMSSQGSGASLHHFCQTDMKQGDTAFFQQGRVMGGLLGVRALDVPAICCDNFKSGCRSQLKCSGCTIQYMESQVSTAASPWHHLTFTSASQLLPTTYIGHLNPDPTPCQPKCSSQCPRVVPSPSGASPFLPVRAQKPQK